MQSISHPYRNADNYKLTIIVQQWQYYRNSDRMNLIEYRLVDEIPHKFVFFYITCTNRLLLEKSLYF